MDTQILKVQRHIAIFAMGMIVIVVGYFSWTWTCCVAESYRVEAASSMGVLALFFTAFYGLLAKRAFFLSKKTASSNNLLLLIWVMLALSILAFILFPSENKDAYANIRGLIGLAVVSILAGTHFYFRQKLGQLA